MGATAKLPDSIPVAGDLPQYMTFAAARVDNGCFQLSRMMLAMSVDAADRRWAILSLVCLTAIWSFNWIVMKNVLQYIGPFTFAASRCLLGAALLLLMVKSLGRSLKPPPFSWTLAVAVLQTCGMMGMSQWALISGGAGKTALLVYTMPFWVVILAAVFLREQVNGRQMVAIIVAAAGLLLVMQPWHLTGSLQSSLVALTSGLMWGASAVVAKRLFQRYPNVDLLSLTGWQMGIGGLILALVALLRAEPPVQWVPYTYGALAFNAVLATAMAWWLWLFILRTLSAGIAGLSTLAVPVGGVLFSWWLLHEVPDELELIGMVLIVLALAGMSVGKTGD